MRFPSLSLSKQKMRLALLLAALSPALCVVFPAGGRRVVPVRPGGEGKKHSDHSFFPQKEKKEKKHSEHSSSSVPLRLLHLTDLHGWVAGHTHLAGLDADYGDFVSMVSHAKATALSRGEDLLVFDTGDLIEGTGISDAVPGGYHGEYIVPMVSKAPFDALTMGNHDLESAKSIDEIRRDLVPVFKGGYLTSNTNVTETREPVGGTYEVLTTAVGGRRVLVMGFIFNFLQAADTATVLEVQDRIHDSFFAEAMAVPGIDVVVVLNHIAPQVDPGQLDLLSIIQQTIRASKPSTPIVLLSGHSHVKYFKWYDDNAFTIESGKYFEEIGQVDIVLDPATGRLSNDTFSYQWVPTSRANLHRLAGVYPPHFVTEEGQQIKDQIASLTKELGLDDVEGCAAVTYDITAPVHEKNSSYRLLIEEIAPKMLFDYALPNPQFFLSSTGFLRYNLYEGEVTKNDVWTMCGFNDSYAYFPAMKGSLLTKVIETLEGISPNEVVKRPGCLAPETRMLRDANGDAIPSQLPYFVYSYEKVVPDAVYDVLCNSYDAGTIAIVLEKIYRAAGRDVKDVPKHQWYPNTISDTYMIRDYVRKYMPCDASNSPKFNDRQRLARGEFH